MPMDNVTLENTQQSISSRDAKLVASVMVNGKWVNLSDTLEQANVKSDVGTVAKQVAAQQEVVSNAASTADSAVAYANDAIEKSRVNSQAIAAQSEAISEAKSAMDSTTAEIQQAIANAASDAANIRADVAQVQNEVDTAKAANSASVEALKSDVSVTKHDLADVHNSLTKAQAAAEESQKAIGKSIAQINDSVAATNKDLEGVRNDLTKAQSDITANQKSINDNVAQINSDIEQDRKDIASAQQANADTVKQLDAYSKQAQDQGKTIKSIQDKQDGFTATLADVQGNVTQVSDKVDGLSANLKDAQDNVASVKAQADQLSATLTDHAKSIATLTASAKELSSTLEDADGRLSKVEQTATGTQQTVANQQGQINSIQTDVSGIHETITGQGNQITTINATLNGLDTKYEGVSGDLNNLKSQAQWVTVTDTVDLNNIKTPCHEFLKGAVTNAPNETAWWYLTVEGSEGDRITQTVIADQSNNRYTRRLADSWSAWVRAATQTDVTALSGQVTTNTTQITQNKQAIALKADQSTVDKLSGEVSQNTAQLKVQADQISSKVSSSDFKTLNDKVNGAISSIQKNSTAIDQTNKQISLKADQTEVDQVKQTATQNSSRLNVMANEISSKVTSTDVNNIVDSKGYATTSTVQSLITQKAGTINESITNLTSKVNSNNGGGVNLQGETDACSFPIGNNGNTTSVETYSGSTKMIHAQGGGFYTSYDARSFVPTPGETYTLSADVKGDGNFDGSLFRYEGGDNGNLGTVNLTSNWQRVSNTVHVNKVSGQWIFYVRNSKDYYVKHIKIERGSVATPWTPAPSDNATVTQVQSLTASIDGIQSTVANKADKSQITQLSNVIQSKVSSTDFNNLRKAVDLQTLDSADINSMKTNGHYFVRNLANNPVGGWVYVDVTGNGNDRIRQDVYQDSGIGHKYRRLFGTSWTGWEEGATESEITQLSDAINLRVAKGDVISQINEEAGGNTLIQVSNGKKSLILDAGNTIVTGKAWIPSAAIANLTADQIQAGTLSGSTIHLDDNNGNTIDLGGLATNYVGFHSKATNGDNTYIDYNGIHNYGSSYDTKISQGKITTNLLAVNGGGLIDFRAGGSGVTLSNQEFRFYNSNSLNGGLSFSGTVPIATVRDGTIGNELRVRYDQSFALTPITDESARICASSAAMQVGFVQSGSSSPGLNTTGLWVDGDQRHVNLGVWGADSTWARVEANTHNIHMQANDAHAWLSGDNVFHIYRDNDGGSDTATKLQVDGWAWVKGWVEAAGHSQHSALSTKTALQAIDNDEMLEMVNDTDLTTFLYKTDVANGETHRHIGPIIDDVHDVAQYQTPQDFIAPNGVSRDDDNMIGALFGAVKALTKRIETLESKVG